MANSLNKITTKSILDATVATADIAADAVTGAKIADEAIDSEHITPGAVDANHIAASAINDGKISSGAVITAKIADDAVTLAKMAGLARGKVIVGDGNGDPAALAAGSNGQVLTMNANGDAAWATAAAGTALTGSTNNTICTVTGADAIVGEGNLTFDGTTLDINGKFVNTSAAGGDYIAKFQNETTGTPYTVQITEPGSATAGYPLINISNSDSSTEYFRVDSVNGVTKLRMHAGAGIEFSAYGGSNANLLDDYEEGEWNPNLYGTGSAGTTTYTTRSGSYTKIGNLVTCNIYLNWSNQTGSGDMAISSFPFTRKSGTNYETVGTVVFSNWDYNSGEQTVGYMGDGTILYLRQCYDNEAWQGVQHDSSGELMASVTYRTT